MNYRLFVILTIICAGCSARTPVAKTYQITNDLSSGIPNQSFMSSNVVPTIGAQTITAEELYALPSHPYNTIQSTIKYMGSKQEFDYYMYCPSMSFRKFYRVASCRSIDTTFPLTADESLWLDNRNLLSKELNGFNVENIEAVFYTVNGNTFITGNVIVYPNNYVLP